MSTSLNAEKSKSKIEYIYMSITKRFLMVHCRVKAFLISVTFYTTGPKYQKDSKTFLNRTGNVIAQPHPRKIREEKPRLPLIGDETPLFATYFCLIANVLAQKPKDKLVYDAARECIFATLRPLTGGVYEFLRISDDSREFQYGSDQAFVSLLVCKYVNVRTFSFNRKLERKTLM
ncbi:hypothetical protein TcasGA2_TC007494 [Tribolium castaneum]|uniref:Uncharacterized protein n=1 Tax=Tribolium castaneum TaxID=7070 RepID=D1ZZ92_TRICA|nr:hypothetical protein TcasGA2_TC007494 [Tribolium castaneum]